MNGEHKMAVELALRVSAGVVDDITDIEGVEVVICPPFVFLHEVADHVRASSVLIGAQNCHWEDHGAFTGEVSPAMLQGLVDYVIVGHSERRSYFGETDDTVNKKVRAVLGHGFRPIMCIGETLEERQGGRTEEVLDRQLSVGLRDVAIPAGFIVAYEPVWAIGTGVAATAEMANETIGFVRRRLIPMFGEAPAHRTRILYGGSVTPDNFAELMAQPEIDGGLVGGASLKADDFNKLVRIAAAAWQTY
jgi:triosephosphate isomerase (TIM)